MTDIDTPALAEEIRRLKLHDIPVVRLDCYAPRLPDECEVEIFVNAERISKMRPVNGGFMVKIIAINDKSYAPVNRQLVALLRQCGEALEGSNRLIKTLFKSNQMTSPVEWDAAQAVNHEALAAIEPIIGDEKNLDSSTE